MLKIFGQGRLIFVIVLVLMLICDEYIHYGLSCQYQVTQSPALYQEL